MSLLHKASRHSRSSASITSQLLSATQLSPSISLRPNSRKANHRVVTLERQAGADSLQRLLVEPHLPEIVAMKTEQQLVTAVGGQREDVAGWPKDGHFGRDRDD